VFRDGGFIGEALALFGGLKSMGRGFAEDPPFFQAAGAAAQLAVEMINGEQEAPSFEPSNSRSG
jgi:hypothetical protein